MQEITTLTWGDIYKRKMEEMTWERAYEQAVLQEEAEQRRKRRGWRKLLSPDDVVIGSIYGTADGMVKVQDKAPRGQSMEKSFILFIQKSVREMYSYTTGIISTKVMEEI